ncbi:bestrophin family protein [Methylacidimicrobium sp. B4]|uniref:bestrophin family protein n=1 Tax=Methylacidimicrobium sp. B4 TaxID=2796139 RepID=UPI001A8E6A3D|nr:bestrophin family ion channel [Methylacidimicrobium sp. B4]QSR84231.1 hypothetical protein MacB4_08335 [Methylacidimicrobium sp. B4]
MMSSSHARGLIPTFWRAFSPIVRPVLLILLVSLLATLADLPTHLLRAISIPDQPLALMGALIGVVLAFRTNLAYARWWEARTLWGNLANASRTWLRQIESFVDPSSSPEAQHIQGRLIHHQVAFVHAVSAELRGKEALPEALRFFLPTEIIEMAGEEKQVKQMSNRLLLLLGRGVAALHRRQMISEQQMRALDLTLTAMTDAKGGCERIRNTPFPWEYDGYLHILTYAYCLLLPIAIADETGPLSMIAAPLVGLVLLMLNQIGRNLENPFDHSLDSIPLVSLARELENELLRGIVKPPASPIHNVKPAPTAP